MPPPSAFATPDQLLARFGVDQLKSWFRLEGKAFSDAIALNLQTATGEMNAVFARGGYIIPIDPAASVQEPLADQLLAMLAMHCCNLAAWYQVSTMVEAPEGLKRAKEETAAWLTAVQAGTEDLLGMTRGTAEAALLEAGRVGMVRNPNDINLPKSVFERHRNMEPGPGPWGGLDFFGPF